MKIVVVGTGYVGLPAALMWARAGASVLGVDIDSNVVQAINDGTMLLNEDELDALFADERVRANLLASHAVAEADVFVIAVPTPVDPLRKVADLSHVKAAVTSVAPYLRPGNLVIVESTVPPMTCRDVVKPMIENLTALQVPGDVKVAHCPERILPGDIFTEIVQNERIIGGMDTDSTRLAAEVYSMFVEGTLHETDDVTAELAKLLENSFRDVNIALANEFAAVCENLGVDARGVIGLANRHPRVNILNPGVGVGGHCIPVDPWFLKEVAPYDSRIVTMARLVNDEMPARVAARIRSAVSNIDTPYIVLLGATYKRNCEDQREAPARAICEILESDGYNVLHVDPLVEGMGYESLADIAKGAHLAVVLVAHDRIMEDLETGREAIEASMQRPAILILDR